MNACSLLTALPPKEGGNWMDGVFDWCVELLLRVAAVLGLSYNEINVLIFCIAWPIFTLLLIAVAVYQHLRIRRLKRKLLENG